MKRISTLIVLLYTVFAAQSQNVDFFSNLSTAAIGLTKTRVVYDPSYRVIPYPNGDVASDKGVCTDVVIRAYRKMGIDLQKEVHEDMKAHFDKYPSRKKWGLKGTDTNIDHRRVPNLEVFFARKGEELPITNNPKDYLPGDIVTWRLDNGLPHIGIVVGWKSNDNKRNMIVHNIGAGQNMNDCLFKWKVIGHYRYKKLKDMQYSINLNSVIPVRAEASERAEMVTQLLFGESCEVLDEKDSFVKIKNTTDNYTGWVSKKMLTKISPEDFEGLKTQNQFRVCVPIADVFCMTDKTIYRLSAGSLLPFYNHETSSFTIADKTFQIHPTFVTYLPEGNKEQLVASAMLFLNTPYLWGGKNMFGIDCSGFVQTVHAMCGYTIPRDASVQEKEGITIPVLEEAIATDLMFFGTNDRVTHTGIYLGNGKIIHSSGKVRIDKVDEKGIFNEDTGLYTHSLTSIKRI